MFASSIKTRARSTTVGTPVRRGRFTVRRAEPDGEQSGVGNPIENVKEAAGVGAEGTSAPRSVQEDASAVRHPATPASAVEDTLKPRVSQLRNEQMVNGTSDIGRAPSLARA
jgi:hypothetical protein